MARLLNVEAINQCVLFEATRNQCIASSGTTVPGSRDETLGYGFDEQREVHCHYIIAPRASVMTQED